MSGATPSSLGKYEIRGTLGKGAMGIVYDGWDPAIDRRVAIKTLVLPDAKDEEAAESLARFKREAQAAGRLSHPNIVGVYDYGETDDLAYIVMEFVEGRSLKEVLAESERMTAMDAVALMEDVLAGLTYSHTRGVVHRDIKPANIMMTRDGRAKIADFGIARIESSSMTQAGTIMGTPAYMSPEQFMGQVVDRRTDIYSCGVMLYQLLTGERPFDGSMASIMHKATTTVPPRPSELAVTAPVRLDAVVARAMAKRPEDRYDNAADFAAALRAPGPNAAVESDETLVAAPKSASARPPQSVQPATSAKGRGKLPIVIAGGVAAAVVVAGVVWFVLPWAAPPVREASVAPALPVPATAPPAPAPTPSSPSLPAPASPANPAPAAAGAAVLPQTAFNAPASVPTKPTPVTVQKPAEPAGPSVLAGPAASRPLPPQPVSAAPAAEAPPSPLVAEPPAPRPAPTLQASNNTTPAVSAPPVTLPPPGPFQPASTPPEPDSNPAPASTPPARSVPLIDASLASNLPAVKCSLARSATAPDGTVTLSGLAGAGQPEDALRRAAVSAGSTAVDWQVRSFSGPYCPALDVLRPVVDFAARARNAMEMVQSGGPAALKDNDVIALQVTMPGFAGYLHVEYLQNDGTVSPQVPGPGYPAQTYAARAQVDLGTPRQDFEGWHVGPPFGTDMIVAVASTAPLFAKALPDSQPLGAYLNSLQAAIEALRRRGGSVAAAAVLLDTRRAP